jgi:BirA family biotin operon repressor/biotin-[acetyl-CoA-carboxylase] ligase
MKGIIGGQIFNLSEVDSTNNFAAKLISDQLCQNGAVIMADFQIQGKGQRGNQWLSNKRENLMMSVVYQPDNMSVEKQVALTWGTSIALVTMLNKFGIEAKVKWPNDIFVHDKKIAGILIENHLAGKQISSSIIGIGLNVNQLDFSLPSATSMAIETFKEFHIKEIGEELIKKLNEYLFLDFSSLKASYQSLLYLRNQEKYFEDSDGLFIGKILGITEEGFLLVSKGNESKEYGMKELTFRIDL